MAVFDNIVCIRGDYDVQKLEISQNGRIILTKFFNKITPNCTLDIISDDIGDFWVSDESKNIKKIV